MYPSARMMQDAVNDYFDRCEINEKPPTMAGMALSLGFSTVASLNAYSDYGDDYKRVVESARTRVEAYLSEQLIVGKNAAGPLASLRQQHGWTDARTVTTNVEVGDKLADLIQSLNGTAFRPGSQIPGPVEYAEVIEFEDEEI